MLVHDSGGTISDYGAMVEAPTIEKTLKQKGASTSFQDLWLHTPTSWKAFLNSDRNWGLNVQIMSLGNTADSSRNRAHSDFQMAEHISSREDQPLHSGHMTINSDFCDSYPEEECSHVLSELCPSLFPGVMTLRSLRPSFCIWVCPLLGNCRLKSRAGTEAHHPRHVPSSCLSFHVLTTTTWPPLSGKATEAQTRQRPHWIHHLEALLSGVRTLDPCEVEDVKLVFVLSCFVLPRWPLVACPSQHLRSSY